MKGKDKLTTHHSGLVCLFPSEHVHSIHGPTELCFVSKLILGILFQGRGNIIATAEHGMGILDQNSVYIASLVSNSLCIWHQN